MCTGQFDRGGVLPRQQGRFADVARQNCLEGARGLLVVEGYRRSTDTLSGVGRCLTALPVVRGHFCFWPRSVPREGPPMTKNPPE